MIRKLLIGAAALGFSVPVFAAPTLSLSLSLYDMEMNPIASDRRFEIGDEFLIGLSVLITNPNNTGDGPSSANLKNQNLGLQGVNTSIVSTGLSNVVVPIAGPGNGVPADVYVESDALSPYTYDFVNVGDKEPDGDRDVAGMGFANTSLSLSGVNMPADKKIGLTETLISYVGYKAMEKGTVEIRTTTSTAKAYAYKGGTPALKAEDILASKSVVEALLAITVGDIGPVGKFVAELSGPVGSVDPINYEGTGLDIINIVPPSVTGAIDMVSSKQAATDPTFVALWFDQAPTAAWLADFDAANPGERQTSGEGFEFFSTLYPDVGMVLKYDAPMNGQSFKWDFSEGGPAVTRVTAVPEPASLTLLGLGALGLIARRRR